MEHIFEILHHVIIDTLQTIPILYIIYLFLELVNRKWDLSSFASLKAQRFGPFIGAVFGTIPQCGFSAAFATLYKNKAITAGTLIAVILATSDEAIPVLLSNPDRLPDVMFLILTKIIIAIIFGYIFGYVFFKNQEILSQSEIQAQNSHSCEEHSCCSHTKERNMFLSALIHTLKITAFIAVVLLITEVALHLLGEDKLASVLLSGTAFQPILCALFGLIPGCATSVIITELFMEGAISFGSCVAGLCTGAGFGFVILFKTKKNIKQSLLILLSVFLAATISGMILHLFV